MILRVCGIDPGLSSGAVAIYGLGMNSGDVRKTLVVAVPIHTTGEGAAKRIDVKWLQNILEFYQPDVAYIENAQPMAKQGISSTSRYMRAAGAIEATVECCGIRWVSVPPKAWQRALGFQKASKKASLANVRYLFPEWANTTFKLQKSHNVAEAALIAVYGAMRNNMIRLEAA